MRLLLFLFLLIIPSTWALDCHEELVDEVPFFIKDRLSNPKHKRHSRLKDSLYSLGYSGEKLRDHEVSRVITRKSIVQAKGSNFTNLSSTDSVKVKIIKLNDLKAKQEEAAKISIYKKFGYDLKGTLKNEGVGKSRAIQRKLSQLKVAKVGEEVFLPVGSLKKISDYRYYLKADELGLKLPEQEKLKGIVALKPKMSNGKYAVNTCCKGKKCFSLPLFNLIYGKEKKQREISFNNQACFNKAIGASKIIPEDMTQYLEDFVQMVKGAGNIKNSIIDFDIMDSRGLVKFPIKKVLAEDSKEVFYVGPYQSLHYKADDENSNDIYIKPTAACSLMKILKDLSVKCRGEGCQFQFGDIFHKRNWYKHKGHESGTCIDIRPMKKVHHTYGTFVGNRDYDRKKTDLLVDLLTKHGATQIIFGDSRIKRKYSDSVTNVPGHKDHIHACFDEKYPDGEPNSVVLNNCKTDLDYYSFSYSDIKTVGIKPLKPFVLTPPKIKTD